MPYKTTESRRRHSATRRIHLKLNCPWKLMLTAAKYRAKKMGLEFDLTREWAEKRWTGKCEVSGLPFSNKSKKFMHPFSPSLDKIIPNLGYTQDNCRFILFGINALKGSCFGDFEINTIAKAIVKKQKEAGDERW